MPEPIKLNEDEMDAWIDGLLASAEARPAAPAQLHARVRDLRNRKRQRIAACGFAATVAAATLATVLLWPQRYLDSEKNAKIWDRHPQLVTVQNQNPLVREPVPIIHKPVATFVARSDLIVVPIESGDPTVTIVQLYPTIQAQRRWRRQASFQAILSRTQRKSTTPVRGGSSHVDANIL